MRTKIAVINYLLLLLATWTATVLATRYMTREVEYGGPTEVEQDRCFSVHCLISVFDPYRWTRNGIPLDHTTSGVRLREYKTTYNRRNLTVEVEKASPENVGEYRCVRFSRAFHHVRILGDRGKQPELEGIMLYLTKPLLLDCPVNYENDTVKWFKNAREVEASDHVYLEETTLNIPEPNVSDAGEYTCWVGDPGNGHILLVNHGAQVEQWSPEETEISVGGSIILRCRGYGYPQPKITWFVGNVILSHLHHGPGLTVQGPLDDEHFPVDYLLHLWDAYPEDEAIYTCRAHNEFGSQETSILVRVKETDVITNVEETDRKLLVKLGEPFVLQCNSTHQDGKLIEWYKNEELVRNDEASGIYLLDSNNSLLVLKAHKSDLGEYHCIIRRRGSIDSARIFVHERILTLLGPTSRDNESLVVMRLGHNLTLQCNSSQNWEFIWYKDGELLNLNERVQAHGKTLVVTNASKEDAGDYMCVVRADHVQRLINASVTVGVAPEVIPFPISEAAKENFRWQIQCRVSAGVPDPNLLWFKDGEPLDVLDVNQETDLAGPRSRIRIRPGTRSSVLEWDYLTPSDRGFYTCLADNGVASPANTTLFLRVRGRWAALWPFLGICCEVAVLAVTILLTSKGEAIAEVT